MLFKVCTVSGMTFGVAWTFSFTCCPTAAGVFSANSPPVPSLTHFRRQPPTFLTTLKANPSFLHLKSLVMAVLQPPLMCLFSLCPLHHAPCHSSPHVSFASMSKQVCIPTLSIRMTLVMCFVPHQCVPTCPLAPFIELNTE